MKGLFAMALGLGVMAAASATQAATIDIVSDSANSSNNLGDFEGSITYDDVSLLTIVLKNTTDTPGVTTAYLTGFIFNINGNANAALIDADDVTTVGFNESAFDNTDSESGSPFGDFDEGAALGGAFLGGGSPNSGIAIGQTGIFKFNVTGVDASSLTVADFLTTDGGESDFGFLVRFRGIDEGAGSDKVPAKEYCPPTIPLPAAAWSAMSMLGLLGVGKYGKHIRGLLG